MQSPEDAATMLLREHGISGPPVRVEQLAADLGCIVSRRPFDDEDISGLLLRDGETTMIGINSVHGENRQRFTIAHEIGHLTLHPGRPMILEKIVRVNLRDPLSSQATDRQEIEANQFAAALLMPRDFILSEWRRLLDRLARPSKEDCIQKLAAKFDVSALAMEYRLTNLGLIPPE